MAIFTWAEAVKASQDHFIGQLLYASMEDDPLFPLLPMKWWPGGKTVQWNQITSLPTATWRDATDSMSSTAGASIQRYTRLKEVYVQEQVPPRHINPLSDQYSQLARIQNDMALSFGQGVRDAVLAGERMTVAIGGTAASNGIDGVEIGPGHNTAGVGYLKFDDTADTIQYKAPGSSSYGATVSTSSDLHSVAVYDGDDTSLYILLTMDVSDSEGGGDWTTTNAATGITLTDAKKPDGLLSFVHPDNRTWGTLSDSPTAAGDGASLKQLDWLLDQVPGNRNDLLILTHKRTRRTLKHLLAGSSDTVDDWRGTKLARPMLAYEGVPIYAHSSMPINRTPGVGGTISTAGVIALVKLARDEEDGGFSTYFWNEGGSNYQVEDRGVKTGPVGVPGYYRDKGEMEDYPDHLLRLTGCFAPILKNTQCAALVDGIND
jgi:hypothetical protein